MRRDAFWEFSGSSRATPLRSACGSASAMLTMTGTTESNTTSGARPWDGVIDRWDMFHSAYQPTEPAAFHRDARRAAAVSPNPDQTYDQHAWDQPARNQLPRLHFHRSGLRQRTHAADGVGLSLPPYRWRRTSSLSAPNRAAELCGQYKSDAQKCFEIESICTDATAFRFPDGPLVIYLFNPFPESGNASDVFANLEQSLRLHPRWVYVGSITTLCWSTCCSLKVRIPAKDRRYAPIFIIQQSVVTALSLSSGVILTAAVFRRRERSRATNPMHPEPGRSRRPREKISEIPKGAIPSEGRMVNLHQTVTISVGSPSASSCSRVPFPLLIARECVYAVGRSR